MKARALSLSFVFLHTRLIEGHAASRVKVEHTLFVIEAVFAAQRATVDWGGGGGGEMGN